jgi:hypothetical protein
MMATACPSSQMMEIKHPLCFSPYVSSVNKCPNNHSPLISASFNSKKPSNSTLIKKNKFLPKYDISKEFFIFIDTPRLRPSKLPVWSSDHPLEQSIPTTHRQKIDQLLN